MPEVIFRLGVTVPEYYAFVGLAGTIVPTNDGGETWHSCTQGVRSDFTRIQFFDSQSGWATSYAGLFSTEDGGRTWLDAGNSANFTLSFINSQSGWVGDYTGNIDRTDNGGISWTKKYRLNVGLINLTNTKHRDPQNRLLTYGPPLTVFASLAADI